jgi:hypothetical protein
MQNQAIKPSSIFSNNSARLFRQFEVGGVVERAQQTFKEKTYLERYKNLYTAANVASFVLQGLSALFAFTFGQHLVANVLPQFSEAFVLITSCFLAALLLVGIEVFKRLCLGSFIISFIQSRASQSGISISWGALVINVILIGIAVYTSTQGAKEFTQRQSDKSGQIKQGHSLAADSVTTSIQKQIDAEKTALAEFKRSVSWKGKINMADKNTAFTIASYNRRLEKLQNEKSKALATLDAGLQTDLNDNAVKTTKDSGSMFWVSLLVELSGLLCIWFVFFFLSRVFIENKLSGGGGLQENRCERHETDHNQNPKAYVESNGPSIQNSTGSLRQPIGFQRNNEGIGDVIEPPIHSLPGEEHDLEKYHLQPFPTSPSGFMIADMQGFIKKYENVVKCLEEGLSNKQASKRCKVSETTVHNVKRCLKNLSNGKVILGENEKFVILE